MTPTGWSGRPKGRQARPRPEAEGRQARPRPEAHACCRKEKRAAGDARPEAHSAGAGAEHLEHARRLAEDERLVPLLRQL